MVCGVEFRNASGKLGPHPFPAGLNDCTSALLWFAEQRARLGVGKIVVSGESGGGNLTLATTLKAKRDGHLDLIDGVYAQCPYISNAYESPVAELTSLFENDGYFLSCEQMGVMAMVYDPSRETRDEPAGVAVPRLGRRPRRAATARHLGQRARPAARRGPRVLPQARRSGRARGGPHRERHLPRR